MGSLKQLIRGKPYALLFSDPDTDFEGTPCYLIIVNADGRLRLKYEPGEGDNHGVLEDHSGVQKVAFRLTAEFTRDAANLPKGDYQVYGHIGPLEGIEGDGDYLAELTVTNLLDGSPVA